MAYRERVDLYIVDAFASRPMTGNPAAVVLLTEDRDERWMQSVAAEMNLAETAFVHLTGASRPGAPLPLRWFTPTTEVDLCGHATVAAAHVLGGALRFETRSGVLSATTGGDGWVELDFPLPDPTEAEAPAELAAALPGVSVRSVHQGGGDLLVEVASEEEVREVVPDLPAIAALPVRGVLVTARGARTDIVSRCFFPRVGVDEDPVTGSAHCLLGAYWGRRLGRTELVAEQASRRSGTLRLLLREPRIGLVGRAFTTVTGRLQV